MTADNRVRVQFVLTDLRVGGAERAFQTVVQGLDPERFSVGVTTLYGEGPIADEMRSAGVPVVSIGARRALDPTSFRRFYGHLRYMDPDVVFLNSTPVTQAWVSAARLGRRFSVISALHYNKRTQRSRRSRFINRVAQSRVDRFVALSDTHKREMIEREGLTASKIAVIPNGVDVSHYSAAPLGRVAARSRFGFESKHVVIGILARMRPEKRHDFLLESAAQICKTHAQARFLLLGDGPEEASLRRQAITLGLGDRVVFAGHQSDVPGVIGAVDIGVLCSRFEALPLSLLEFMAAGVPVVATDVGSVADVVVDGETGLIVPEGDLSAFTGSVETLIVDALLRARFADASARRARERFPVTRTLSLVTDLINEVVRP